MLDGGLEGDAITLVFGEGGSGKTNLALQCARQAAAAGVKVAYIDTEGVSARRLEQVFSTVDPAAQDQLLFFQPYSIAEQERMVEKTALLKDVGLVVVDSINMHYRLHIDGGDDAEREASRSLYRQLHHLTTQARKHGVPVLITGQVFGAEDATQPFARRVMEHLVKALVRFEKRPDGTRRATVLKHRSIEEGRQARFRIGATGLEDADGAWESEGAGRRGAEDTGIQRADDTDGRRGEDPVERPAFEAEDPARGAADLPRRDGRRDAEAVDAAPSLEGDASAPAHDPGRRHDAASNPQEADADPGPGQQGPTDPI